MQHQDPLDVSLNALDVLRSKEDCDATLPREAKQDGKNRGLSPWVQISGGLIEDQDLRPHGKRRCNRNALFLAP